MQWTMHGAKKAVVVMEVEADVTLLSFRKISGARNAMTMAHNYECRQSLPHRL